jgi:hypothetical protein
MPIFEKMRVSLAREDDSGLLADVDNPNPVMTRTEHLTAAFGSEHHKFLHNKSTYTYTPIESPEGYAGGFFSRERQVELRHSDLSNYYAEDHEPALFVLSLDKAQIIWMENRQFVGDPKRVLESFFDYLLRKTSLRDWRAFVHYFERQQDYWDVVRSRRQEITKVIFRLAPPNALEGFEAAQRFYTDIQTEAGNAALEETFRNKPGHMNLEGPMMTATAEVAEQGGGEREIRGVKNKLLYKSEQGRVSEPVPDEDMPTIESQSFVRRVIGRLFGET